MREYLFRGKAINNKNWIIGGFTLDAIGNPRITTLDYSKKGLVFHEVIPETIGQFTGLTDKNGVKIFDGDKIRGISNNPFSMGQCREYAVIWGIDHWHIEYTHFTLQELFNYCNNNIEVIGNAHDNPELIK